MLTIHYNSPYIHVFKVHLVIHWSETDKEPHNLTSNYDSYKCVNI